MPLNNLVFSTVLFKIFVIFITINIIHFEVTVYHIALFNSFFFKYGNALIYYVIKLSLN